MNFQIVYSARRTAAIQILPDGTVVVRAPYGADRRRLEAFVQEKAGWIEKHQAIVQEKLNGRQQYHLVQGSTVPFLGKELPVRVQPGLNKAQIASEEILLPPLDEDQKRRMLAEALAQAAHRYLPERVAAWSNRTGLCCRGITITSARTRWGSCSGKNTLAFSWRLMHASPDAIDAVVVHELCHTRYHNHGPNFYALLEKLYPKYKQCDAELKGLQIRLSRTLGA